MAESKKDEAKALWKEIRSNFRKQRPTRVLLTGDGQGSERANLYWSYNENYKMVREQSNPDGRPFPVLDRGNVGNFFNVPVVVGYDDYISPETEQILGVHWDSIPGGNSGSFNYSLPAHHWTHEFNGGDTLFIDNRVFLPGLVVPTEPASMRVYVKPFAHYYNTWGRWNGGCTVDLSEFKPASGTGGGRYITIAHNPVSNTIEYIEGDYLSSSVLTWNQFFSSGLDTGVTSGIPTPDGNQTPLGAVLLTSSTSVVHWIDPLNMADTRSLISPSLRQIFNRLDNLEGRVNAGNTLPRTGAASISNVTGINAGYLRGKKINPNLSPSASDVLVWDSNFRWWTAGAGSAFGSAVAGNGDVGSANNLGTGSAIWKEKSGASLIFRTVVPGTGINLDYTDASHLRITASTTGGLGSANNLGVGSAVWRENSGASLTFRTLIPGPGVNLDYTDASHIRFSASAGASSLNIDALTREMSPSTNDLLAIFDSSASAHRSTTWANLLNGGPTVQTMFVQTTTSVVQNTTTSRTLFGQGRGSKFIPASTLQEGTTLRFRLFGFVSDTGTPSPSLTIQLNNTTLASANPALTGVTNVKWMMDGDIICRTAGVSGTVQTYGLFDYNNGAETAIAFTNPVEVNTMEEAELRFLWTWDVANSSNSVSSVGGTIEKLMVVGLDPVGVTELLAEETV